MNLSVSVLVAAGVGILAACSGRAAAPATASTAVIDTAAANAARRDSIQRESARLSAEAAAVRQRAFDDSVAKARATEEARRREAEMLRATVTAAIGFEFNKSELRDDTKAALDAKIPILLASADVTMRVSGHADERGSTEYNLALGNERAATAKRYLVQRGVAAARIETTSFGEERPLCTDDSEDCWSRNRRAEFEITAGTPTASKLP